MSEQIAELKLARQSLKAELKRKAKEQKAKVRKLKRIKKAMSKLSREELAECFTLTLR